MESGTRISKLLRDARASVKEAARPETPADLSRTLTSRSSSRQVFRRLSNATTLSVVGSGSVGSAKRVANCRDDDPAELLTALKALADELSRLGLCDDSTAALVAAKLHSADAKVQVCASAILLKFAQQSGSQHRVSALETVHSLCKRGNGEAVRDEMLFDAVIQTVNSAADLALVAPAAAALRYASGEAALQKHLITLGALVAVKAALRRLGDESVENCTQVFVYLVTSVRNFSVSYAHHVAKLSLVKDLFPTMLLKFSTSTDAVSALARAAGKLAFDDECAAELRAGGPALVIAFTTALSQHRSNRLVVSRLSLALAHLLHNDVDGSLATSGDAHITEVIADQLSAVVSVLDDTAQEGEELLTNVVRLIANLCIDEAVGRELQRHELIVTWLLRVVRDRDIDTSADLILNSLIAICNLSFFFSNDTTRDEVVAELGVLVAALLFSPNADGALEATRILGNVSRLGKGRAWVEANRIDEVCSVLLAHSDERIVFNCLGVFLNLTAAGPCALATAAESGEALIAAVRGCAESATEELRLVAESVLHNICVHAAP